MKQSKNFKKKALLSVLVIAFGATTSAKAIENVVKDPLFSLKELNGSTTVIAHGGEGKCGEGKCGEGKCGGSKIKSREAKCGEGKCGVKKLKKVFKKKTAKTTEAKCGEGKCGADKKQN